MNTKAALKKLANIPVSLFILAAMVCVFSMMQPKFFTVSNMMNIIVQCSTGIGIIALASFMAICSTGVDLSLGGIMSFAGIAAARVLTSNIPALEALRQSNPALLILIAILCALAVGAAMGSLNGLILSKTNIPSFIVTLATFKIGETMARVLAQGSTIRVTNDLFAKIGGGSLYSIMIGKRTVGLLPYSLLIMMALYIIFAIVMRRSRYGTYIYAIGGNYDAAMLSGINVDRTRFKVFLFNGLIAALAGVVLTSRLTAASASNGLGLEFDGIAAAVVGGASMSGGKSTPLRTLIGALIIATLSNGLNMIGMDNAMQMVTPGFILIVIVAIDAARSRGKK